jgi:hypothetical protein
MEDVKCPITLCFLMSFENFSDRTTRKTNGYCFRSIGYRTDYCLGWFFLFNGGAGSAGGQGHGLVAAMGIRLPFARDSDLRAAGADGRPRDR